MTTTNSWLPLAEYSMKHHVSISTLRRRIKSDDINYRFDDGKYFILDEAPRSHKTVEMEAPRPSLKSEAFRSSATSEAFRSTSTSEAFRSTSTSEAFRSTSTSEASEKAVDTASEIAVLQATTTEKGESVLTAANKLLVDLKKAYTQVLHEKEEQIMNLKEEVVDLRTLIKVLESENSRLREHN